MNTACLYVQLPSLEMKFTFLESSALLKLPSETSDICQEGCSYECAHNVLAFVLYVVIEGTTCGW